MDDSGFSFFMCLGVPSLDWNGRHSLQVRVRVMVRVNLVVQVLLQKAIQGSRAHWLGLLGILVQDAIFLPRSTSRMVGIHGSASRVVPCPPVAMLSCVSSCLHRRRHANEQQIHRSAPASLQAPRCISDCRANCVHITESDQSRGK